MLESLRCGEVWLSMSQRHPHPEGAEHGGSRSARPGGAEARPTRPGAEARPTGPGGAEARPTRPVAEARPTGPGSTEARPGCVEAKERAASPSRRVPAEAARTTVNVAA